MPPPFATHFQVAILIFSHKVGRYLCGLRSPDVQEQSGKNTDLADRRILYLQVGNIFCTEFDIYVYSVSDSNISSKS